MITKIYSLLLKYAIYKRVHLLSKKIRTRYPFISVQDNERQEKHDAA
ncbi:hypothetical protein AHZ37_004486 [Salmonella enterica subsp. indica]|nr:hypothetical protein [Salmonella enterica subsp. enterica]EDR2773309.1 hypothetical protein [Salmonella enterica subsp. enterica serovar Oslo]EDT9221985.1 hypothetical protein [Salmonella enterica subsp. indica]EEJ0019579.1 hypothetical protein [Salmonella enterica subsp. enterica]EEJ9032688.1 hypothetical protein [Salmonella enterica subsp. enterica serovar Oslo]